MAARLRRLGCSVRSVPSSTGFDFLVNGVLRVTLRVGYPSLRRHRVKLGGRIYEYRYRTWHFNFHHHGRFAERYTDFFVCVAQGSARGAALQTFILPWESVTGKTFSLHDGRRGYGGRYAVCRDRWDLITSGAHAVPTLRDVA